VVVEVVVVEVEVEVVVVEVEVVVIKVVKVVVVKVVVVNVLDVADGLVGIEISISVDDMIGKVSISGELSELDDSGGSVLISGTIVCCVVKLMTSSFCFVSAMAVVGAEVVLALTRENH
jgi:hypothetical protein